MNQMTSAKKRTSQVPQGISRNRPLHFNVVKKLIEQCKGYKFPLAVGLVHNNRTFDSVEIIPDVFDTLKE